MSKRRREKIKAKTANRPIENPKQKGHIGPLEIKCFMGPEFSLSGINYNNGAYKKGDRRKARKEGYEINLA